MSDTISTTSTSTTPATTTTAPAPAWLMLEDAARMFGFASAVALSAWARRAPQRTGLALRRGRDRINVADLLANLDEEAKLFAADSAARAARMRNRPNLKTARP